MMPISTNTLLDGCIATQPKQASTDEGGVSQGHSGVLAVQEGHGEHSNDDDDNEAQKDRHHDVVVMLFQLARSLRR